MITVRISGPGERDLIPGRVTPKLQNMELEASLLNTQHYSCMNQG